MTSFLIFNLSPDLHLQDPKNGYSRVRTNEPCYITSKWFCLVSKRISLYKKETFTKLECLKTNLQIKSGAFAIYLVRLLFDFP